MDNVYVPDEVTLTQFGESLSLQLDATPVPPFATRPDQPPECPPATRVRVTPASDPLTFQPLASVSNPGFPTRFCDADATVTVTTSLLCRAESSPVSWRTYVPGSEKLAVVAGADGSPKVTVPGPETFDQVVVRVAGGFGRPSSVAVPDREAAFGKVTV
jgi:hypothetical protein